MIRPCILYKSEYNIEGQQTSSKSRITEWFQFSELDPGLLALIFCRHFFHWPTVSYPNNSDSVELRCNEILGSLILSSWTAKIHSNSVLCTAQAIVVLIKSKVWKIVAPHSCSTYRTQYKTRDNSQNRTKNKQPKMKLLSYLLASTYGFFFGN